MTSIGGYPRDAQDGESPRKVRRRLGPILCCARQLTHLVWVRFLFTYIPFLTSCLVESRVAPAVIRNLGSGLVSPQAIPSDKDGFAKLGPLTRIRGIASDGALTPWYESGELWVYGAGLSQEPWRGQVPHRPTGGQDCRCRFDSWSSWSLVCSHVVYR
jgi:hypothetical protein